MHTAETATQHPSAKRQREQEEKWTIFSRNRCVWDHQQNILIFNLQLNWEFAFAQIQNPPRLVIDKWSLMVRYQSFVKEISRFYGEWILICLDYSFALFGPTSVIKALISWRLEPAKCQQRSPIMHIFSRPHRYWRCFQLLPRWKEKNEEKWKVDEKHNQWIEIISLALPEFISGLYFKTKCKLYRA